MYTRQIDHDETITARSILCVSIDAAINHVQEQNRLKQIETISQIDFTNEMLVCTVYVCPFEVIELIAKHLPLFGLTEIVYVYDDLDYKYTVSHLGVRTISFTRYLATTTQPESVASPSAAFVEQEDLDG